jgi:hypothetical protein
VISVACFKWKPKEGYRSKYSGHQVNVLRNMVARHYQKPHRFICVTDDAEGIDEGIEIVPLWDDHAEVPNPSFADGPSCYRRLKTFSRDIGSVLGDRFVCIDLDVVIVGDLTPIFDRTEDFVGWRNPVPQWPLNGSLFMMNAGARPQVWETFDPDVSPVLSHGANMRGSDQGWMSYVLGWNEAMLDARDGVISYQKEVRRNLGRLPKGARIVVFWGRMDPWSEQAQKHSPWIKEHYR